MTETAAAFKLGLAVLISSCRALLDDLYGPDIVEDEPKERVPHRQASCDLFRPSQPVGHRQLSTMLKWWRCLQSLAAARQHAFYRGEQIDVIDREAAGICRRQGAIRTPLISVAKLSARISSGSMMNEELRSISGPFGEGAENLGYLLR